MMFSTSFGLIAQLGERGVRNAEVEGSNPFGSTINVPVKSIENTVAQTVAGDKKNCLLAMFLSLELFKEYSRFSCRNR